jgi:hypothetical protein
MAQFTSDHRTREEAQPNVAQDCASRSTSLD